MATVILTGTQNEGALAFFVAPNKGYTFDSVSRELGIVVVTQPVLDQALIDYAADQAAKDSDFQDFLEDVESDAAKDSFDSKADITALIKVLVEELNTLRALHALPDLNFGTVNASIRSRIGNP
jgi:hypothetical protein